jgi:alpha-tubulin suppressor-like RCC1 family protein
MIMGDTGIFSCGGAHTSLIDINYNLYTCGLNANGQLGDGSTADSLIFIQVTGITGSPGFYSGSAVKQVSCGGNFTSIIDDNNDLYTCGYNEYGQLGLGTNDLINPYFIQVIGTGSTGFYSGSAVKQVSCGENFTAIIDDTNNLYTCGINTSGQLGQTSNVNTILPNPYFMQVNVTGITGFSGGVKQVSCGSDFTAILDDNYNLYTCGSNGSGQLGLGETANYGSINPNPDFMPVNVTGITGFYGGVKQVSCGGAHTAILDDNYNLYTCGSNNSGQLGLGNTITNPYFTLVTGITGLSGGIKQVSCGSDFTSILNDYNIYTCGNPQIIGRGNAYSQNSFYPIEYQNDPQPATGFKYKWFSYGSSARAVFAGGFGPTTCFSEGTKILCLNNSSCELSEQSTGCLNNSSCELSEQSTGCLNNSKKGLAEEYRLVQDLKVGDFVKSYLHGYRRISKMLSGTFINNPTDDAAGNCMYKMVKTDDNELIDDVIITRNHGVLVSKLSEKEAEKVDVNNLEIIDGLISIIAGKCDNFEKVNDTKRYNYCHFSLETDGDNDRRFGVWANGLLVETPSNNMMDNAKNVKPFDF